MRTHHSPTSSDPPSPHADDHGVTVYRWTCPICEETRPRVASGNENPAAKAEFSLRQHVLTSGDSVHGSSNTYPEAFDPDAAREFISLE